MKEGWGRLDIGFGKVGVFSVYDVKNTMEKERRDLPDDVEKSLIVVPLSFLFDASFCTDVSSLSLKTLKKKYQRKGSRRMCESCGARFSF